VISLRKALVDSHIAAIAIAVLLSASFSTLFEALWQMFSPIVSFVFEAIAILDIPYFSYPLTKADRSLLIVAVLQTSFAILIFAEACCVSYLVYRAGPFRVLAGYRTK
jgi:hypothetical protein